MPSEPSMLFDISYPSFERPDSFGRVWEEQRTDECHQLIRQRPEGESEPLVHDSIVYFEDIPRLVIVWRMPSDHLIKQHS